MIPNPDFIHEIATRFDVFPQQVDALSFVLTISGIGALVGTFVGVMGGTEQQPRSRYVEGCAVFAAGAALLMFILLYLHQELL